jgi:hypothetical protein
MTLAAGRSKSCRRDGSFSVRWATQAGADVTIAAEVNGGANLVTRLRADSSATRPIVRQCHALDGRYTRPSVESVVSLGE